MLLFLSYCLRFFTTGRKVFISEVTKTNTHHKNVMHRYTTSTTTPVSMAGFLVSNPMRQNLIAGTVLADGLFIL
jgi:hypothetical protein